MTANAFMSVSLEPPLVLISVDRRTKMCGLLHEGDALRRERPVRDPGGAVGSLCRAPGRDCRAELRWCVKDTPLVDGALAHFVARVVRSYWGGDHSLFLGRVEYARQGAGHAAALPRRAATRGSVPMAIVVGVVGDSGAGKTTLTRGLVRVLGDSHVTHVSADDYHRYDRSRARELGVTPLHPDSNHLDILTQHLSHLRRGEPVLKPVYSHRDGRVPAAGVRAPVDLPRGRGPAQLPHRDAAHRCTTCACTVAPPEELRRAWKLKRDCTRRGYTTDEVLAELDRRQADAEVRRPAARARRHRGGLRAERRGDPAHLDADVILRDTLPHPDLSPLLDGSGRPALIKREREWLLRIPGDLDPAHAAELEEAVWERMSFASHLRIRRLGEFTVGTDLLRSDSLALVQLLILYHVVTARAALAIGGSPPRAEPRWATGADSALHA